MKCSISVYYQLLDDTLQLAINTVVLINVIIIIATVSMREAFSDLV